MRYALKWPVYKAEWDHMAINKSREGEFIALARFAIDHKETYQEVEKATGVAWYHVAVLHRRESDADFSTYLGNGDPLSRPTRHVPRGRGPFKSFQAGAVDALKLDGLAGHPDMDVIEKILWYCENFNGLGYEYHGLPSPYIFGGTNIQARGKFVGDGDWNPYAWDGQPGCAPILQMIGHLDSSVKFVRET